MPKLAHDLEDIRRSGQADGPPTQESRAIPEILDRVEENSGRQGGGEARAAPLARKDPVALVEDPLDGLAQASTK